MEKSDLLNRPATKPKHPKCLGYRDYWGEFDCGYGTTLICEECKYSGLPGARKDPAAKCNQPHG